MTCGNIETLAPAGASHAACAQNHAHSLLRHQESPFRHSWATRHPNRGVEGCLTPNLLPPPPPHRPPHHGGAHRLALLPNCHHIHTHTCTCMRQETRDTKHTAKTWAISGHTVGIHHTCTLHHSLEPRDMNISDLQAACTSTSRNKDMKMEE